ncbi:MAG: phage virion morphogenesis protein [Gammaproteobacteria bacterium]|nr:phage virion morphogenesis protein [Gammaproteobacteria bacterium]MYD77278.1 phage virion morphogenesis protein [Gammaproteobacteria bacterium]MYJ52048.1 phage virion morphogenesis protein [Gammaproteobacteria bacterium]
MAGSRIRIDLLGSEALRLRLGKAGDAFENPHPLLAQIGEYLVGSTKERFRTERDPSGAPWAPLSEATLRRKKKNRDRILTLEGYLGSQISWRASRDELLVGSSRKYAGTHQFGAKKGQYGTTSRGSPVPWGDIPARPFLGVSDDDEREILDLMSEYVADAFGR